jgi:hypothetical protein
VFGLEGFYVISCSLDLIETKQKITSDVVRFAKKALVTKYDADQSVEHHVNKINNTRFKGQIQLIEVQFVPWSNPKNVFKVVYKKKDGQCTIPKRI